VENWLLLKMNRADRDFIYL